MDSSIIDYFASILLNNSKNKLEMHKLDFIAKRYKETNNVLKKRSKAVEMYSLILDSAFLSKLVSSDKIDYNSMDLWLLKMINNSRKSTIRHIIIPYCLLGTWILI